MNGVYIFYYYSRLVSWLVGWMAGWLVGSLSVNKYKASRKHTTTKDKFRAINYISFWLLLGA